MIDTQLSLSIIMFVEAMVVTIVTLLHVKMVGNIRDVKKEREALKNERSEINSLKEEFSETLRRVDEFQNRGKDINAEFMLIDNETVKRVIRSISELENNSRSVRTMYSFILNEYAETNRSLRDIEDRILSELNKNFRELEELSGLEEGKLKIAVDKMAFERMFGTKSEPRRDPPPYGY